MDKSLNASKVELEIATRLFLANKRDRRNRYDPNWVVCQAKKIVRKKERLRRAHELSRQVDTILRQNGVTA